MHAKVKKLFSPEIDAIVERFGSSAIGHREHSYEAKKVAAILHNLFASIQPIKPKIDFRDKIWSLWIRSERGPRSAFADDEEYQELLDLGEISSPADLEAMWQSYYPEPEKWHKVTLLQYEREFVLTLDSKLQIQMHLDTDRLSGADLDGDAQIEFLRWLRSEIENLVARITADPDGYHQFLTENLPLRKRYGKIKRTLLWEHVKGIDRLDQELGEANIEKFEQVVQAMNEEKLLTAMTADDFFRYCEICYDANDYFPNSKAITPKEKYRKMADGRDDGLLEVPGDQPQALAEWYETHPRVGHPWEICRGGNSTHISLQAHRDPNGWKLYLAGSSRVRAVETAKMAIALFAHQIPFILVDAEPMARMFRGQDFVGIVSEGIIPRYCHHYFPAEDQIHDIINPWLDEEVANVVSQYAEWYPLDMLAV